MHAFKFTAVFVHVCACLCVCMCVLSHLYNSNTLPRVMVNPAVGDEGRDMAVDVVGTGLCSMEHTVLSCTAAVKKPINRMC